ncbi:MAG: endopeptidase La [Pseudomonadota bacterium]|nr:endopeptidase La [Pseudomonadota bacterium]
MLQQAWSAEGPEALPPGHEGGKEPRALKRLPEDALVLIPLGSEVLFPGVVAPIALSGERAATAADWAAKEGLRVGFLLQREADKADPGPSDLHWVGTAAGVVRRLRFGNGSVQLIAQGEERFRVLEFLEGWPFLVARVAMVEPARQDGPEIEARLLQLKERAAETIALTPQAPDELAGIVAGMESASALADFVGHFMHIRSEEKQDLLETFDLVRRLDKVLALLAKRLEVLKLSRQIGEKTRATFDERQREHVLREQLRQIQNELGEGGEQGAELDALGQSIEQAGMPEEVHKRAVQELRRLERMGESGAEYAMLRSWLECLAELPWKSEPLAAIDIAQARADLDADHFGLDKVKRRILQYLAVRKLNPEGKSPILCFVGPPGVGKTSLGQSIARATGRRFQRIALGGVHDEAEIRGHRRTYVGALPGAIIQAVRRAGSANVVLLLDEIDKLGAGGFHGDPASALLEVLDPEQNGRFRDNYLGTDFDLSRALFICTANVLDTIPGPLRDRMEIIQLPGYTEQEKLQIARRYLLARQRSANGLDAAQVGLTDAALRSIIGDYTREAGVRTLEREIAAALRHVAVQIAEGETTGRVIDAADIPAILGPARYESEVALRSEVPGVATGLAWTPVGGDILFIEAGKVPGSGKLILTGQLGDVMKESAQTAMTLAKGFMGDALANWDIHVHIPAGATPKDGPSAGVALFLALVSLRTGRAVRPDVAMTGEVSLRGLVLPIGGVKEKTLAALRAGIRTVMLPRRNQKDLEDIPAEVREQLSFVWLDRVEDAVNFAIAPVATLRPAVLA